MLGDLVSGLLSGVLGGRLNRKRDDRTAAHLRSEGAIRCSLRLLAEDREAESDGSSMLGEVLAPSSLSSVWRSGLAELAPGVIDFEGVQVTVYAMDDATPRVPTLRETWSSVDPGWKILKIQSDGAELEWALPADHVAWATNLVIPTATAPP